MSFDSSEEYITPREAAYEGAHPRPVTSFASNYGDGYAHDYPGERPETSFLADTGALLYEDALVYPMRAFQSNGELDVEVKMPGMRTSLNTILDSVGQPRLQDRIPIVAYGANVCPKALTDKMHLDNGPGAGLVPTIYADMPGYDVVWHEKPGQRGNGIAVLYKGDETAGTAVQVAVNFLTPEQLLLLHRSEKNYDLGYVDAVTLEGGVTIPALMYAGNDSVILKDGRPIAVASVPRRHGTLEPMSSEDVVNYMLKPDVRHELAALDGRFDMADANEFAGIVRSLEPDQKKAVQAVIKQSVETAPVSMADPQYSGLQTVSWANPDSIPTFRDLREDTMTPERPLRLPEQILASATDDERRTARQAVAEHFRTIIRPKL